jgi:hypothetical protein
MEAESKEQEEVRMQPDIISHIDNIWYNHDDGDKEKKKKLFKIRKILIKKNSPPPLVRVKKKADVNDVIRL